MKIFGLFRKGAATTKVTGSTQEQKANDHQHEEQERLIYEIEEWAIRSDFRYSPNVVGLPRNSPEFHRMLMKMSPASLAGIVAASKRPDFSFSTFYRWLKHRPFSVREAAINYDSLSKTSTDPATYPSVISLAFCLIEGLLEEETPEYVDQVLSLSADLIGITSHTAGDLKLPMMRYLRDNPADLPRVADFMRNRGISNLSDIDLSAFTEAASSPSASLSGGVL